jgi:hypothetical protein
MPAPVPAKTTVASAAATKTVVEPAQPKDWRESWGKVDGDKTPASSDSNVKNVTNKAKETVPAKPAETQTTKSTPPRPVTQTAAKVEMPKPTKIPDLPRASSSPTDPLKDPGSFSRKPEIPAAKTEAPSSPSSPVIVTNSKTPATAVVSSTKVETPKKLDAPAPKTTGMPAASQPVATQVTDKNRQIPLGTASVMAASDAQLLPPSMAMPVSGTQVSQGQESQSFFRRLFAGSSRATSLTPPVTSLPADVANAFSTPMPANPGPMVPGTMQPIGVPANGQAPMMANAFATPMPMMPGPMAPGMVPPGMMMVAAPQSNVPFIPMAVPPSRTAQNVPPAPVKNPTPVASQPVMAVPDVPQALVILRDSGYPSQREWAAEKLASCKWQTQPQVLEALLKALRDDPAASVRAACIRSLAKMEANTVPVIAALKALKDHSDANIRYEAEQALLSLAPGHHTGPVQPAAAVGPNVP